MLERTIRKYRNKFGSARLPRSWRASPLEGRRVYHLAHEIVALRDGAYEDETVRRVACWHGHGCVGFDIGANIGLFSLGVLAKGACGHIYALEPNPATFARLQCTLEANALSEFVTAIPAALADKAGALTFSIHRPELSSGDGFRDTGRVGPSQSIIVPSLTLDAIIEAAALKRVDWLKIDTEGAEALVLAGAPNCLTQMRPKICFEAHPINLTAYGVGPSALFEVFSKNSYRLETVAGRHLNEDGFESTVNAIAEDNFIALPMDA